MADIRIALQKLSRGQALTAEEAAMIGYTQPTAAVTPTPEPTRTGLTPSDYGPGKIPVQAAPDYMDITSQRYTAAAKAAGLTPTPFGTTGPTGPGQTGPTGPTGPGQTGPTGPGQTGATGAGATGATGATGAAGTDPALLALLQQLQQQNLAAQLAAQAEADRRAAAAQAERQSAYDLLYQQFSQYGLGSLVEPLKGFITSGINPSEFTIRLRESEPYKKRFAANAQRISKGLRALSEAEYIGLEDQYQNIMRRYGLPTSYYEQTVDPTTGVKVQQGFEKFIAGDVSPVELEDRVQTAQDRLLNAAPEIMGQLKGYYNINDKDILAYILDPQNALSQIKRQVQAAEVGGAAATAGLGIDRTRAEELVARDITKAQAQQGYQTIGGGLQRGSELASIYSQSPYTQTTAEQEVFGLPSATEAAGKRKKLIGLERATFGGQTGAGGALQRERSGQY